MAIGAAPSMLTLFTAVQGRQVEARLEEAQVVAQLVRRCASGDPLAWEEIVQRFHRRIYNICYRFAGSADDAQDLTQEVFIKVFRTVGSFDGEKASFNTWMTTVARNLLVDHFRKKRNDRATDSIDSVQGADEDGPTLADRLASDGPSAQVHVESRERQEMVHRALRHISPDLREAVILRDLQDMDYREIAQILKVPEGTVKSRINRGRAELARLLQRTYKQAL
ncbi:MAG TPA: sigma-70 family RNA polymerase sigma factor [Candidatus Saccharimonadales bacterium]|nr:sigma-70 family RNA polymerase sigma factor [Candidatus Saccharimonadales bacterium]